ncbi:efflux transporter outer membrane subunit [Serratia ficaria]|uniref:efflux transporter outer membrane subunit n=1 Tax=Serratia ficaria TaxID=61651 RepID=UPI0021784597|nr:efflux transporter outer membrane subunit [Serratia ficaria]CAI0806303.1 Outer membrane protein oprM precursor [Serratia ficaria]CAI1670416.1 Outer membrane protein oprM precursor [Serratia ficaria]
MLQRLISLTLPLLLAGCISLDPDYQRPTAPVPAALPQGAAYAAPDGKLSLSYPDVAWRDYVRHPQLRQVVAMGLNSSRDLREAIANIESARALYGEQRSALFPTINAGADGSRGRALTGSGNAISQSYEATAGTSAFELDLFGKNGSLSRAAFETYLADSEAAKSTRLTLIADIVTDWVAVAAERSNLAAARQTMDSAKRSLEVTRKNQQNGILSMVDVASADTVYQQARSDVASYTTSAAQAKNALDLVVGQSVPENLLPAGIESLSGIMTDLPTQLSSAVLLNRPDVLEAEHNLKSANANIGSARAAFFPTISLTASGGVGSSELSSLFSHGAGVWSFAPSISLPIFSGGYNTSQLNYTKAQKDLYVATYEKAVQTAFQETADALARKGTIQEQLAAQSGYVAASREYYRLAELRYRHGVDSYLTMLDAQRTLYTAQQSLIAAQQTAYDNQITLYKVLGGGIAAERQGDGVAATQASLSR